MDISEDGGISDYGEVDIPEMPNVSENTTITEDM